MNASDLLGWSAAALTLLTFASHDMFWLRVAALGANLCFIAYGYTAGLWPVLALHLVLVPVNLMRLLQIWAQRPVAKGVGSTAVSETKETSS
jgi:hypothetical protein